MVLEETSRHWDRGPIKRSTWTTYVWFHLHYHFGEFFIIHGESFIFFIKMVVQLCTRWFNITSNLGVWVLENDCEHPMIETPRAICKLLAVVLESPYTQFLSGLLDDLTSNHKFELRSGWVERSCSYLSFKQLLYVSLKEKINSSNWRK